MCGEIRNISLRLHLEFRRIRYIISHLTMNCVSRLEGKDKSCLELCAIMQLQGASKNVQSKVDKPSWSSNSGIQDGTRGRSCDRARHTMKNQPRNNLINFIQGVTGCVQLSYSVFNNVWQLKRFTFSQLIVLQSSYNRLQQRERSNRMQRT